MDMNLFVKEIKEITLTEDMQERMIHACQETVDNSRLEYRRDKKPANKFFRKPVMAAMVLCICCTCITAFAANEQIRGYFKDITNWQGAIVGTSYELASDEISLTTTEAEPVTLMAVFHNPEDAPYNSFEMFGINSYTIFDASGTQILEGTSGDLFPVINGQVCISLPVQDLSNGQYILEVTSFTGSKKADQPLVLQGEWQCEFSL